MALPDTLDAMSSEELERIATSADYGTSTREAARALLVERGITIDAERVAKPRPGRRAPARETEAGTTSIQRRIAIAAGCAAVAIVVVFAARRENRIEVSPAVQSMQRHYAQQSQRQATPLLLAPVDASPDLVADYQRCSAGDFGLCTQLAVRHTTGMKGVAIDLARGVALFEHACRNGVALACAELAVAYGRGRGVPADPALSKTYSDLACQLGHTQACDAAAPSSHKQ